MTAAYRMDRGWLECGPGVQGMKQYKFGADFLHSEFKSSSTATPSGGPCGGNRAGQCRDEDGFLNLTAESANRKEKPCCGRRHVRRHRDAQTAHAPQPCLKFTQVFNIFTHGVQFETTQLGHKTVKSCA